MVTLRSPKASKNTLSLSQEQEDEKTQEVKPLLQEEKQQSNSYYYWGYLFMVLIFIPITAFTTWLGDFQLRNPDTQGQDWVDQYAEFYSRKNYFSTSFSTGKFIQWNLLWVAGYLFVTIVNLRNSRPNPFISRFGSYKDFIGLCLLAPLVYFTSPIIFMRSYSDMSKDCQLGSEMETNNFGSGTIIPPNGADYSLSGMLASVQLLAQGIVNGVSDIGGILSDHRSCHPYTFTEVFGYNLMVVLGFFLGWNMTHMGDVVDYILGKPAKNLSLSYEAIKTWTLREWTVMFVIMTISFGYLAYMLWLYAEAGILKFYGLLIIFYLSLMFVPSILLRKKYNFHLHHYAWGWMYMTLGGYQHPFISFAASVHAGISVEGVARWGLERWWYKKHD